MQPRILQMFFTSDLAVRTSQDMSLRLLVINRISVDTSRLGYEEEGHDRAREIASEEDP